MRGYLLNLGQASVKLLILAAIFAALGWLLKRPPGRAMISESRTNLTIYFFDVLMVGPALAVMVALLAAFLTGAWPMATWTTPPLLTALLAIVAGDFFGYWRHRVQHSAALWPAHAIHHSDTALSWASLLRMHPIDRLGTAFDTVFLLALGLPVWAVALNALVRSYYGHFIHANLPWTYGPAAWLFISPVAHRWHHSQEIAGKNFATVFSVWDRAFGTYYCPGPCDDALGIDADMGRGAAGQYLYPFRVWFGRGRQPEAPAL